MARLFLLVYFTNNFAP